MANKKITLKNKAGEKLYPSTIMEQVQGLKAALDGKLGKTEKAASATIADRATSADMSKKLRTSTYGGGDLNTFTFNDGSMGYSSIIPNTAANMPDVSGYQNAVMYFGLHDNGATAQMFFAKDKPLYYRSSQTGEWKRVRYMTDLITTSHIADAAITPAKIQTSIALNGTPSMTVEPTVSSPDKTIASVGLAKQLVEDIEIGGRNLIRNGDFSQGAKHWESWNKTAAFSVENGVATFVLNPSYADILKTSAFQITSGQEYIVSFDVRSDDITVLNYCYLMGVGVSNIYLGNISDITAEWQHKTFSFTATSTGSYCFGFGRDFGGGSFQLCKVKIEKGNKATDWTPSPEDVNTEIINAETRSKSHAEDYTNAEITKIENGETIAQKANSLYDDISGDWKEWKDVTNAVGDGIEEVLKQNNFATKDDIQTIIPNNATETGAGIVRAATQAEVTDGHVSDNDPSELAFVRPETLQSKLTSYPTTTAMIQAISESKEEVKGVVSAMDFPIEQVQGLKEKLDEKLPLSGGTLTGNITAPSFRTNLTSGVAETVMAYPVNISWGNDLNSDTYLKAGMYQMSSKTNTLNQPSANGFGNVITIRGEETTKNNVGQIYLDSFNKSSKAYIRAGQIVEGAVEGYHILDKPWREVRFMDDKVTTSHIADAAITPAKIQTSIALNGTPSMTVEPTVSSPDKTIASVGLAKQVVDNVEIGGTNLILNSDFSQGSDKWSLWYNAGSLRVVEKIATFSLKDTQTQGILLTSPISLESGQQYMVSFDIKSDSVTALNYSYLISSAGNISLPPIYGITSEWQRIEYKFSASQTGDYNFGFGIQQAAGKSFSITKVKIEKGNKATDWTPSPEDVNTEIINAETRSKSHAEDYTDAEITKIKNGETAAQKANSLYDDDSGTYKNWGEIDSAITDKIGDRFEDYATKSYVQEQISNQVSVPIASETEYGKVQLAKPEDVTAAENDSSAVNDAAKAVTPYTLKEYIASKGFATGSDISDAKPTIFYQAAQPASGKDGDIWIIP